ncbi:MAG: hypothetical protein LAO79_04090 [Acidobacteriia bacterium]|nr:hypothetical protein [Terriglobia bacterium]
MFKPALSALGFSLLLWAPLSATKAVVKKWKFAPQAEPAKAALEFDNNW